MNLQNFFESANNYNFDIGDPVIITGNVQFRGKTGDVKEFGRDGSFVVVDLYNHGPQSFQTSDVSYNDYADSDDEQGVAEGSRDRRDPYDRGYHDGQRMGSNSYHNPYSREDEPTEWDEYKSGFNMAQIELQNDLEDNNFSEGVAEGGYPEVDHMPGPTIKRTQTGCKRCHGKGYVYKTPDGEVHPMNRPDAKKYKCGKCDGIGFVKVAEQGVAEGWKEKVGAGLTAAAMATSAGGVVLNPARPIGPKGQTVANPYPNKATNTKSAEDDAWTKIEKRKASEKKIKEQGVAEGAVKELSMDLRTMSDQAFQRRYKMTKAQARANLKTKPENMSEMRGFRGVGGARGRENDENEKIDAMLRQQDQQRRDYEQTGKFWLKKKDTQEHISDAMIGKAAANAAAVELLRQRPELRGNLVITAYGPGETQGVAEGSLNEDKGFDVVKSLVSAFNDSVSGDANIPLAAERPSSRVWTRSDGTRYRDHGNIRFYQGWIDPQDVDKWKATKPVEKFWDWLKSQPGVKSIGQVSGEFRRDPMRDAVAYKGQYFVLTPHGSVIWGSVSRFKNPRSVWRQQGPEQGVAEVSDATLTSYLTKLDKDNLKHKMDPTKRSDAKRMKSGPNLVKAFTKLDNRKQGVAEGAGNIGNAIKSLYRKIYRAGDDEIEYFYNASPIFAQYWDEYEGDLDSIIAEVDPEELAVIKAELESYAQDANLAEAPGAETLSHNQSTVSSNLNSLDLGEADKGAWREAWLKQRAYERAARLKQQSNKKKPPTPDNKNKEKGVAEGSLNELSKDTLKAYAKKAVPDMQASQKRSEIEAGKAASTKDDETAKTHYDAAKQAKDRTEKRMAGISGAIKRVTKQGMAEGRSVKRAAIREILARNS